MSRVEERVATLEAEGEAMRERLVRLEARVGGGVHAAAAKEVAPSAARPSAAPPAAARDASRPRAARTVAPLARAASRPRVAVDIARVEDLLGGRALAWVGGAAVFAGLASLLALAISRGWIGEEARTGLAAVASLLLLAGGARLYERRGHTDAALAAVAAGIAGLFATLVVAAQVYELVPALMGVAGAIGFGALATWLAIRWDAPGLGALGIVGALSAPALLGAFGDPGALVLLWIATASATAVVAWRRWTWLAFAAFLVTTPQWIARLPAADAGAAEVLVLAGGFGLLAALAAVAFDLRTRATAMRRWSCVLLAANALVCAATGWWALQEAVGEPAATAWLVALAAAHAAGGLVARRRTSPAFGHVLLALGVLLGDLAFAALVDGAGLAAGWTLAAIGFAALHRAGGGRAAELGLGAHVALALGQALVLDASGASTGGLIALACAAGGCFAAGQVVAPGRARWAADAGRTPAGGVPWAPLLDALGLAGLLLLWVSAFDGVALALACSGQALVLAGVARRTDDRVAVGGALAFLAAAAVPTLAWLAPPEALVAGLPAPAAGAGAALAALAAATAACALRLPRLTRSVRAALVGAAALAALHLASTALLTAAGPGDAGQALLSGFWALAGVSALVAGLVRDVRALRLAALALLGLTVGKVFLLDLAALESLHRVASFSSLGVLLLLGAFAWQRIRPRPDLRAGGPAERLTQSRTSGWAA